MFRLRLKLARQRSRMLAAVVADAEAGAENAAVVLEELESIDAAETDSQISTAEESVVENVPDADAAEESEEQQEQAAEEGGA